MGNFFKNPIAAQENEDGSYDPSPLTLLVGTSKKTSYVQQEYGTKYTGSKPILVVCTDERFLVMKNQKKFSTGNHPVEMFLPMLHFRDAGFTFDIATQNGNAVELEMWAFPTSDENVKNLHEEMKNQLENPKKLSDISSLDGYSAIFIPGGHGAIINLPFSNDLGNLLHMCHDQGLPTVTLCHGPASLLSTGAEGLGKEFAYEGYEIMCFTDKTDEKTPSFGYMPGQMLWKVQEALENKGVKVLNKGETGEVKQDRELITGDSPTAADNLGKIAAPILAKYALEHKL
mmetsp:Transcript_3781/g.5680  ORF Transcript_3781/g.5680 Transcript_3781/m.5680 type:complete len:287 (+) Transcript_3781:27-887(+)|eukprot:CAMPEP_0197240764 /NCGR_PEP_ID=MMETSP1429-20130617/6980_1 /TAXON_ID=49237 /ORGANISM="Chaetoceros  sp., Strain UNC1202" /LENGTH=286 /DNA_ID=CAMNT_0042700469 /DNA_START=3 /DNA_END=863 /DNA_ORIENTATION=-